MRAWTIAGLALLLWPGAAMAEPLPDGSFSPQSFICPLGDARFEQVVEFPHFPLETFPDGSHPGDEFINAEIAQCPGNGLVILPDYTRDDAPPFNCFTAEELAKLPALIGDPAYKALAAEGRHAQAWWLARALDRPAWYQWDLMLRASWHARDGKDRVVALTRLVEQGPAVLDAMETIQSKSEAAALLGQRLIVVNALRELGRFDEALKLANQLFAQIESLPGVDDADNPGGWDYAVLFGTQYAQQFSAISERNQQRRPMAMMSPKWAAAVCNKSNEQPLDENMAKDCAERAALLDRETAEVELMMQLLENPESLDLQCASTAEAQRNGALQRACEAQQFTKDMAAGDAMKSDPVTLAKRCEATAEDQRDGALRMGCISYDSYVESEMSAILASDDTAFTALCADVPLPEMRKGRFASPCQIAEMTRDEAAIEALLAQPELLDPQCAKLKENEWVDPLSPACLRRKSMQESAVEEALANDDAAFAERCGRYAEKLAEYTDNFLSDGDDPDLRLCRLVHDKREWNGVRRLLGEPEKLKTRCDSTRDAQRDAMLDRACLELESGMADIIGIRPGDPIRPPFAVSDEAQADVPVRDDPMQAVARPKAEQIIKDALANLGAQ